LAERLKGKRKNEDDVCSGWPSAVTCNVLRLRNKSISLSETTEESSPMKLLTVQPETFYNDGIEKLVDSWTKCGEEEGNFVK
jgi:hypothetical protein